MRGISIDVLNEIGVQERVMKQLPDLRHLEVVPFVHPLHLKVTS
jgi:hypothetical protein